MYILILLALVSNDVSVYRGRNSVYRLYGKEERKICGYYYLTCIGESVKCRFYYWKCNFASKLWSNKVKRKIFTA